MRYVKLGYCSPRIFEFRQVVQQHSGYEVEFSITETEKVYLEIHDSDRFYHFYIYRRYDPE